ncbi:hypothetical protein RF11_10291 [Thelohanellus kitauei]|uniref:Uncharacterized protein n=1 Tax=Thelohanellus kitauei TaxID=669202 RepID=A0A0C2JEH9_THEKT|nr:hypothetical protein RF11_10291 [Thelohanellus kitauei]
MLRGSSMVSACRIFASVLLMQLMVSLSLQYGRFPVSRQEMTDLMVRVITCSINRSATVSICSPYDFGDLLSDCVQSSVELGQDIDRSEVDKLYEGLIRLRVRPKTPPYHSEVFTAISDLVANHTSFDDMTSRWEAQLRSVSSKHYLPDHEYIQAYCYYTGMIESCHKETKIARVLFEGMESLVHARKVGSELVAAAMLSAEADRDSLIQSFIEAYKHIREGATGNIIPLLLRSIKSELSGNDEISHAINRSALIVYECVKILYRDGSDLEIEEVKKHLKLDPLEKIIKGPSSLSLAKVKADTLVLAKR